jgi:hypothetical protein
MFFGETTSAHPATFLISEVQSVNQNQVTVSNSLCAKVFQTLPVTAPIMLFAWWILLRQLWTGVIGGPVLRHGMQPPDHALNWPATTMNRNRVVRMGTTHIRPKSGGAHIALTYRRFYRF